MLLALGVSNHLSYKAYNGPTIFKTTILLITQTIPDIQAPRAVAGFLEVCRFVGVKGLRYAPVPPTKAQLTSRAY